MAREWTDDEVKKEIADAVQIVRADKIDSLLRSRLSPPANDPNDPKNGGNNPPPSGGNGNPDNTKKRGSLWWGVDPE